MKRVVLEYDEATGKICDQTGPVFSRMNLRPFEDEYPPGLYSLASSVSGNLSGISVSTLVRLREAGYDAEDIIAMHKAGVL